MSVINKLRNRSGVGLLKDVSLDPHEAHDILALLDQQAAALALAQGVLEGLLEMDVQHRNNVYLAQQALEAMNS